MLSEVPSQSTRSENCAEFKVPSAARQTLNRAVTLAAGTLSISIGAIPINEILLDTAIVPF